MAGRKGLLVICWPPQGTAASAQAAATRCAPVPQHQPSNRQLQQNLDSGCTRPKKLIPLRRRRALLQRHTTRLVPVKRSRTGAGLLITIGRRRLLTLLSAAAVFAGLAPISAAHAYDRAGAAAYADRYWVNPNAAFMEFGNDCTNFVGQAMHLGGGRPFRGSNNNLVLNDNTQWWYGGSPLGSSRTYSWSVAHSLYRHLRYFSSDVTTSIKQEAGQQADSGPWWLDRGDVVFYDWNNDGQINHASIITARGTDASGLAGPLMDQHSNSRYHTIWHNIPNNSQWASTQTWTVHINA